jgi:tetratricopeptide (TPR) repeat protein
MRKRVSLLVSLYLLAYWPVIPTIANADEKLVDLVKKVKPCVVYIETFDKDNKPIAQGSGFFIDNKGSLITNHHVIEGAYSATIKTSAGKVYPVQGIIAKDTEADIVKLVVNLPDANITFLNLSVNVPSEGEDIFVIGNPAGLESTVSTGIVSAVRDIPAFGKIFQITAPISLGSSGSPVINSKGQVIGIATLIITEGQNLNFAIPSDKIIALKETAKTTLSESYASLTADANGAQLFYDKGLKELWQENWSAALTYFQKATEKNRDNADAWFGVGCCYGRLGRYQDEIEAYKQAIRIKPDYAEAHHNLGLAYGKLGRYQEAIEAYKQAIRIKPDLADAHYGLGLTYSSLDRDQDAIEAYKQAIRIKPDLADAHCGLGIIYGVLGQMQDAIESFKQAIRIEPDNAEAHYMLGFTYLKLGRFEEAIESFKQAIRIKPDYAEAHNNLGLAYLGLGRWQDAIESYKQAIRIKPDYAEAHCNLGAAYSINGDKGSALEEYKILKTLDTEQANKLFNFIYK